MRGGKYFDEAEYFDHSKILTALSLPLRGGELKGGRKCGQEHSQRIKPMKQIGERAPRLIRFIRCEL